MLRSAHKRAAKLLRAETVRHVSLLREDLNETEHAFRHGALVPRVVPFRQNLGSARAAFEAWHRQHWFAPSGLLRKGLQSLHEVLLPFWLFEAAVRVEFSASGLSEKCAGMLGFAEEHNALRWEESETRFCPYRQYPWTLPSMQVSASYEYRPDLAAAAKVEGFLGHSRRLTLEEASAEEAGVSRSSGQPVPLLPPGMRQAVAWQLCLRGIRRAEAEAAARQLRQETGAEAVRDIKVRVHTLRRRARLVFLPAFAASYSFGEGLNQAGERFPQVFQAVASGLDAGSVAAERLFSPHKVCTAVPDVRYRYGLVVQAAVAGGVIGAGLATAAVGLVGYEAPELVTGHSAFLLFMACTSAGLAARFATQLRRETGEEQRAREEEADLNRVSAAGLGPMAVIEDHTEDVRVNAEWRRWEEADKWAWNPAARQKWAEEIWRSQHLRHIQHMRVRRERAAVAARQQREAEREAWRQAQYGPSSRQTAWEQGGGAAFAGGARGGGRLDHLGYYSLLGLSAEEEVSQEALKRAFRKAALLLHPDVNPAVDEAQERFRKLRAAYDVLRDPQQRRRYDMGANVG